MDDELVATVVKLTRGYACILKQTYDYLLVKKKRSQDLMTEDNLLYRATNMTDIYFEKKYACFSDVLNNVEWEQDALYEKLALSRRVGDLAGIDIFPKTLGIENTSSTPLYGFRFTCSKWFDLFLIKKLEQNDHK